MVESKLKTPIPVYIVSALILSISVIYFLFFRHLQILPLYSLVLLILAGASVLIRHKLAWIVGVLLCILFVGSIAHYIHEEHLDFIENQKILLTLYVLCSLVLYTVVIVFMYYRYPYVDQRQSFFSSTALRYKLSVPLALSKMQSSVELKTMDISYSGFRAKLPGDFEVKVGQEYYVTFTEWQKEPIKVLAIRAQDDTMAFKIMGLSRDQKNAFKAYLERISLASKS